jgi:glycosyltransferase involved in cell wall biosynthesis
MVIDVTRLVGRFLQKRLPTGVDRVDIEYVRVYGADAQALIRYHGRWLFCSLNDSKRIYDALIHRRFASHWRIRFLILKAYYFSFWYTPPKDSLLFNLSHSGLHQSAYEEQVQRYGLRLIVFIHDLIPITHPEYGRLDGYPLHVRRIERVLRCAKGIIVNSNDTLMQLQSYAQRHVFVMPPSVTAHLASAPLFRSEDHKNEKSPYFVMLGTIEPRKNHWLILHIWRKMVEEMGELTPQLVIIGQRGWECENIVALLEQCASIHPYIIEKTKCSDEELSHYLTFAQALLFPSFVEGYGLPLAEALSLKTPVIASNLGVFREIAQDIPHYLEPLDGKGWEAMIREYMKPDSLQRAAQITRMEKFQPTTWEEHFGCVNDFLETLA